MAVKKDSVASDKGRVGSRSRGVIVVGHFGFDNFGDDIFAEVAPSLLGQVFHDCSIVVMDDLVEDKAHFYGVRLSRVFRVFSDCFRAKHFVLFGGSQFGGRSQGKLKFVLALMASVGLIRLYGFGLSLPPGSKLHVLDRWVLGRMRFIGLRDHRSVSVFKELTDSVEVASYSGDVSAVYSQPIDKVLRNDFVLVLANVGYEKKILEILVEACARVGEKCFDGFRIVCVNSARESGDKELSQWAVGLLESRGLNVSIEFPVSTQERWLALSSAGFVCSVRLHGAFAAYFSGVPFYLVEYNQKCSDFLDDIGLDDRDKCDLNCVQDLLEMESRLKTAVVSQGVCLDKSEYIKNLGDSVLKFASVVGRG